MYQGKRILGLITARGGSKGIPRKNLVQVGDKPLIAWTIEAARNSELLDRLVLSTDDEEIAAVAHDFGCEVPFMRPPELAADVSGSAEVVLDCLKRLPGYDYLVLLQPTSPLRAVEDIDGAIRTCLDGDAPACVSVCDVEESPFWMYTLEPNGSLKPILANRYARRQELPPVYVLNGAVYIADTHWFATNRGFLGDGTVAYVMPRSRSLDIDTPADLQAFRQRLDANE
ncbi:acylneuraminate cytidylyltransferase family protein [Pseudomonas sp. SL4(2022)]|uniref:acylneuraminate cytidylyltransferase family protein n=1 Tax=Pseudomonas sp. SL4(2022) TaxID=2994661 RepID=UPI002271AEC4|nr:acylneuraminate cytidylyltransferase family protein [Pseudomonas sp. SL4(2022)]WAC44799.1 acylneuraminate cytidylyltransferase family protein [Pseudomonas sp. SL4(2022)]